MKDLKEFKFKIRSYYNQLKKLLDSDQNYKKTLTKRHSKYFEKQNKELITGSVVIFLILIIIFSIGYYYLIFNPSMEELKNEKNVKINEVNSIFKDNLTDNPTKQALLSQINSASSVEELQEIDVESIAYPVLKNQLSDQINQLKDNYDRVQLDINGSSNIMSVNNASSFINSSKPDELSDISVTRVDSVIIPLSINRKQAASGLLAEGDVVDIYKNDVNSSSSESDDTQEFSNNSTLNETNDSTNFIDSTNVSNETSKLVGGSKVVSILRSKDSGSIDSNLELNEYPKTRNISQSNSMDVEEVLSAKAAGVLDESQLNILLSKYGGRLSDYERIANVGDLDAEYIIMVEVPRDSVNDIISNMDNIIVTIPTYNAPSWVNLRD